MKTKHRSAMLTTLISLLIVTGCTTDSLESVNQSGPVATEMETGTAAIESQSVSPDGIIRGYNMRWNNTPLFNGTNFIPLMEQLAPPMIRYPGGTMAHIWNWQAGRRVPFNEYPDDIPHPIEDVKILADALGAEVTFVVEIVNRPLADQINMLHTSEVDIKYIELGNELYDSRYAEVFPTGREYAEKVNVWAPRLREEFPDVQLGVVMIGRGATSDDSRALNWNDDVQENLNPGVADAYIYHIYVAEEGERTDNVQDRMAAFDTHFNPNVDAWYTETGQQGTNERYPISLELAEALTDPYYRAKIILNHCINIPSGRFSKIVNPSGDETNYEFNAEGIAFRDNFIPRITPIDDSHIRGGTYANDNFGDFQTLQIRQSTNADQVRSTFLKFDITGINNVTSAKLRIFNIGSNSNEVRVRALYRNNWNENTITWNNRPVMSTNTLGTITLTQPDTYYYLDVTNYTRNRTIQGDIINFEIEGINGNEFMAIGSKEGDHPAELLIVVD